MIKTLISTVMVASILLLAACGGRDAEPVIVTRHGDDRKSCEVLIYDIEHIEFEIHKLLPETEDKTMKNIGYGVAGFYTFFIPWLLIDFSNAEAKEYEALRARHEHLSAIAAEKGCDIEPKYFPTQEEVKKDYEIFKKGQSGQQIGEPTELNRTQNY